MAKTNTLSILIIGGSHGPLLEQIREAFPGVTVEAIAGNDLQLRLQSTTPRVALCDLTDGDLTLDSVSKILRELQPAVRLIALASPEATADPVQVMSRGARDVVSAKDHLHLRLVLARELGVFNQWCERNAQELRARAEREPAAYLNGEELEWSNEAFARLLERSAPAQIQRRAFWLCIDGDDHHPLRRALRACAGPPSAPQQLSVRVVTPDGKRLPLSLQLSAERLGGRLLIKLSGVRKDDATTTATGTGQLNVVTLKRLRAAIAGGNLAMAVQPISGLAAAVTDQASKLDVLIRIKDGAGELAAADFMREASAAGLLKALDHWVVVNACSLSARNPAFRESLFFLRISRQALQDAATLKIVRDAISNYGMKASQLSFEVPETEFAALPREEAMAVFALRKLGCRFTISQFGTRPDSLTLLQRLPMDFVKLDAALTAEASTSEAQRNLLKEVVARASARNIGTISTRVSDATTLAALWKLGIHFVQGYYVQEPEIVVGH